RVALGIFSAALPAFLSAPSAVLDFFHSSPATAYARPPLPEQDFNIVAGKIFHKASILLYQVIRQHLLPLLQLQDLFFDGILADHLVGEDFSRLTDPVGAVDGLHFRGGIPPGIDDVDVVGHGQVEPDATGL